MEVTHAPHPEVRGRSPSLEGHAAKRPGDSPYTPNGVHSRGASARRTSRMIRKPPVLTRRQALLGLGLAAGAFAGRDAVAQGAASQTGALLPGSGACILTPEVTEGPFYFDPKLERSDITDGRHGVPM